MTQYVQYSESYSENWMTDMNEWQWKEIKQLLSRSGGLRVHVETFLINDVTMEFRFKFITSAWIISSIEQIKLASLGVRLFQMLLLFGFDGIWSN